MVDEKLAAFVVASHHRSHPDKIEDVNTERVETENTNVESRQLDLQLGFEEEKAEADVRLPQYSLAPYCHKYMYFRQRTDLLHWISSCCASTSPMRRPTSTLCCTTWTRRRSHRSMPTSEASLHSLEVLKSRDGLVQHKQLTLCVLE